MKAVMISLRPQWCEKIFNGEKTIEVRKTAPTTIVRLFEPPFKVYVYQTKHKGNSIVSEVLNSVYGGGKVIGSFVCDRIVDIQSNGDDCGNYWHEWDDECGIETMCLSYEELETYLGKSVGYGWHITEPRLFDKPKDITEFAIFGKCADECSEYDFCARDIAEDRMTCNYFKRTFLKRPPQSWCYVEVENDT